MAAAAATVDAVFRRLHQVRMADTIHRLYGYINLVDYEDVFEARPEILHDPDHTCPAAWGPWHTLGGLPSFDDNGLVFETVSRCGGGLLLVNYSCSLFSEENLRTERKTVYAEIDAHTGRVLERRSEHTVDTRAVRAGRTVRETRLVTADVDTERIPGWERRLLDAAFAIGRHAP